MKNFQIFLFLSISIFFSNCDKSKITEKSPNYKIEFKNGETAVKNELQKEFEFKDLSFGIYLTSDAFSKDKKGITFNYKMGNVASLSDSLFHVYANKSSEIANKHLQNIETFDLIVTSFHSSIKYGNLEKETSIKIINNLK